MGQNFYIPLNDRAILRLTGSDIRPFLQGIITNDIAKLTPESAIYTLLLTPQGKFLFDFFLMMPEEGTILIDCREENKVNLTKRLMMYKLRADVQIEDLGHTYCVASILGEEIFTEKNLRPICGATLAFCKGWAFTDPRTEKLFGRSIIERENNFQAFEARGFTRGTRDMYETLRLTLAIPEGGKDMLAETAFPLQFGMDSLHAIDFSKGCYVGQEVTTRMKHRGGIRKAIHRVATMDGDAMLPEAGSTVTSDGIKLGTLYSHHHGQGLALLDKAEVAKLSNDSSIRVADTTISIL